MSEIIEKFLFKIQEELSMSGYSVKENKITVYCEAEPSVKIVSFKAEEKEFEIECIINCGTSKINS